MWWTVGFSLLKKMMCIEKKSNKAFPLELLPKWHRQKLSGSGNIIHFECTGCQIKNKRNYKYLFLYNINLFLSLYILKERRRKEWKTHLFCSCSNLYCSNINYQLSLFILAFNFVLFEAPQNLFTSLADFKRCNIKIN